MIGYRTYIVAAAMFVSGAVARWGFKVDPNVLADFAIIIIPAVMGLMRSVTRTPAGEKE